MKQFFISKNVRGFKIEAGNFGKITVLWRKTFIKALAKGVQSENSSFMPKACIFVSTIFNKFK